MKQLKQTRQKPETGFVHHAIYQGLRVEFIDAAGDRPMGGLRLRGVKKGDATVYRGKPVLIGKGGLDSVL